MSFVFPKITVPASEKNEDWHKKFVQAITNRAISDGFAARYSVANECVNYYLGLQGSDNFDYMMKAEDGEVLPAEWTNLDKIRPKIDLLIGELSAKGYEIDVKALNKEARVRKLQEKKRLLVEMRLAPVAEELEQQHGLPLQQEGFVPGDQDELDDYITDDYREDSEIIMKYALKYIAKRGHWDEERRKMFANLLIMGGAFCETEIIDGVPVSKGLDSRFMVWDPNCTNDFLTDSTYFGHISYESITDVIDQYQLSKEEIDGCYNSYREYMSQYTNRAVGLQDFGLIDKNSNLRFFKTDNGDMRVLVLRAWWVDYKDIAHEESEDTHGNVHVKKTNPDRVNEKVKKNKVQIWRKGTLIAGKFLKDWGEVKNQVRNLESLAYTEPPIKGLVPMYYNGSAVSLVHRLKGLQDMKNQTVYRLKLLMAQAGSKGIQYDISQLPEGWDIHTAMKYMRTTGIQFIDSMKDGTQNSFNQFKTYDLTISQGVQQYLEIIGWCDREMDSISGINEARQGSVPNSSVAVGVQQSALVQSNLSTEMYFKMFRDFCSRVMNYQAKLVKIAWAGKEKFAAIIGDTGINFLEVDVDLDLNDYAVFAEEIPPMVNDSQRFEALVTMAVQSGALGFDQAMELILEKDIWAALRKFKRDVRKKEKEAAEQQQQLMQQEQQQMQAQQQQASEDRQAGFAQKAMDHDAQMKQVLAKGRIDINKEKLGLQGKLAEIKATPRPPARPSGKKK